METQAQRKSYPLAIRSIISVHNGTAHSRESWNITVNIAQSSAAPIQYTSSHKLWGLLCASPMRPRARSARPGLEPIFKKKVIVQPKQARWQSHCAQWWIWTYEDNGCWKYLLTNAQQPGHTNKSRLREDWVDLTPVPCTSQAAELSELLARLQATEDVDQRQMASLGQVGSPTGVQAALQLLDHQGQFLHRDIPHKRDRSGKTLIQTLLILSIRHCWLWCWWRGIRRCLWHHGLWGFFFWWRLRRLHHAIHGTWKHHHRHHGLLLLLATTLVAMSLWHSLDLTSSNEMGHQVLWQMKFAAGHISFTFQATQAK